MSITNELYLVVLPMIHLGQRDFGLTEEMLTLLPDKELATAFFEDEVEGYIKTFENRTKLLTGRHVKSYGIQRLKTADGRIIVRVVQNVG